MVSTTARTAGKPATWHLRTAVDTEPKTIRLRIDADPRLAAAVGGAARYLADAAGIENEAVAQLQSAVIAACREAFGNLSKDHPHLDISLTRLSDRIEVSLSHEGTTSAAGDGNGGEVPSGVDRIQHETQGNVAVTRLTKYINQGAPSR
jgi:hypothetical protein